MAKIIILICLFLLSLKKYVESTTSGLFITKNLNSISIGEKLECEASGKSKPDSSKNTLEYFTLGSDYAYFRATSKNCFSFKIRGVSNVHLGMSSAPRHSAIMLEIIVDYETTIIRQRPENGKIVVTKRTPNILNNVEFFGFWVHYTESGFLEMGREGEITPFISYQHDSITIVNFIGITTVKSYASWLIDLEPKCPGMEVKSERETMEIKCSKRISNDGTPLQQYVNFQEKILSEINTITKGFNETLTSSFGIDDFYDDLEELFKESKSIHKKVIFLETESTDNELLMKEKTIYNQIKEKFFENLENKCFHQKDVSSNCYENY